MEFRILGPLEVVAGGRVVSVASPQQRAILALLLINCNRVLSADRIVDAVWAGHTPKSGPKVLAFHISHLRDALSPGRQPGSAAGGLETAPGGYVLRLDPEQVDALRFERLAREGHALLSTDPAGARELLTASLALWRGDALADVGYADFAQLEISRLEELRLAALEDRLDADLALGEHASVVPELEMSVRAHPLRERMRCLLMLALYRSGRQAEALRTAGDGRRLLSEELGIDPSPELVQLQGRILAQDPALELPRSRAGDAALNSRNPYKGLRAFAEADSSDFFGREALIRHLLFRLEQVARAGRLLAIVGPSGSGKSSVVSAGLLPAVRAGILPGGEHWRIATMRPGSAPWRELVAAFGGGSIAGDAASSTAAQGSADLNGLIRGMLEEHATHLLLVIDQFEELFTRPNADDRQQFTSELLATLRDTSSPLVVVATLRADFIHVPLAMAGFGELLREGTELVVPMTRAELERAITRPAEGVGVEVEPGLVAEMINDVENSPGALPLLEYALTELFDRSKTGRLTRDGYAAIGGVTGALGRRAEEAWRGLSSEGRELARQILLALVAVGETGLPTAQRVPRSELESLGANLDQARAVIDELGRRGLLTFDRDPVTDAATVQVAHESLLVHWSRMADWIEDLRHDLWTRRRLAEAAAEWDAAERSSDFLAWGSKLDRFETWARATPLRLADTERSFLTASAQERDRLAAIEVARIARERRLERRSGLVRGLLAGVLVVALALAATLATALIGQQQATDEANDIASARELAAGSLGTLGTSRQLSVLLALQAASATAGRGYVIEQAYDALQWSLQEAQVQFPPGDLPAGVREAPDGPRGVYLLAPEQLMRLGADYVHRSLTADECRTYAHMATCTAVSPPDAGTSLAVRAGSRVVPADSLAVSALVGTSVRLLSELPADVAPLLGGFEEDTGITLAWDAVQRGSLKSQVDARNLPDLAIIARPSYMASAAHDGWLLRLDGLTDLGDLASVVGEYGAGLGATRAGTYGAPVAASVNDLLWYPREAFAQAGYDPPTTSAELDTLLQRMRDDGHVPWCFGTEAGSDSGSAAAAWLENLLLDARGTQTYDRWVKGEIPFSSMEVGVAAAVFGGYVTGPGNVYGGLEDASQTAADIASLPMLLPAGPECWLYRGASTDLSGPGPDLADAADARPFPGAEGESVPVLGRLYMVVALRDRPEVRQVLAELVGEQFASSLAASACDTGILAVRAVAIANDCAFGSTAARLYASLRSGQFRVDALDLFPDKVRAAFLADLNWFLVRAAATGVPPRFEGGWTADGAWAEVGGEASP